MRRRRRRERSGPSCGPALRIGGAAGGRCGRGWRGQCGGGCPARGRGAATGCRRAGAPRRQPGAARKGRLWVGMAAYARSAGIVHCLRLALSAAAQRGATTPPAAHDPGMSGLLPGAPPPPLPAARADARFGARSETRRARRADRICLLAARRRLPHARIRRGRPAATPAAGSPPLGAMCGSAWLGSAARIRTGMPRRRARAGEGGGRGEEFFPQGSARSRCPDPRPPAPPRDDGTCGHDRHVK